MPLHDLVVRARSYRRFREDEPVDASMLLAAVDTARLVPSAANAQPLRYAISVSREINARIFPFLAWGRLLRGWDGPRPGERPSAYILIGDDGGDSKHLETDLGIAAQTLFLALAEAGLGGCMLGNIDADALHGIVGFPNSVRILQVMAVGHPGEKVRLEELAPGGDTAYWRDAGGMHHVPKRSLGEVLLKQFS